MLTPAFASVENIVAAVPGAPTILPPLTSIRAVCRIALTHLTVFWASACGVAVTRVPGFLTLNVLFIRSGIFFVTSGSSALGCMYFAPKSAISIASI